MAIRCQYLSCIAYLLTTAPFLHMYVLTFDAQTCEKDYLLTSGNVIILIVNAKILLGIINFYKLCTDPRINGIWNSH